jgi:hypothetical protein
MKQTINQSNKQTIKQTNEQTNKELIPNMDNVPNNKHSQRFAIFSPYQFTAQGSRPNHNAGLLVISS